MPTDLLERPPLDPFVEHPPVSAAERGNLDNPASGERRPPLRRVLRLAGRSLLALVLFLVVGNGVILGLTLLARAQAAAPPEIAGVDNLRIIDDQLWRSAAPSAAALDELAARGVTTLVDLRAESDLAGHEAQLDRLGMERVRIPIRDGQLPTDADIARFLTAIEQARGTVLVHCGAGVGRTGAMVAAYRSARGEENGFALLRDNLAVGPPSLEQIVFAGRAAQHPSNAVTVMSRVLDSPRRIWHNVT